MLVRHVPTPVRRAPFHAPPFICRPTGNSGNASFPFAGFIRVPTWPRGPDPRQPRYIAAKLTLLVELFANNGPLIRLLWWPLLRGAAKSRTELRSLGRELIRLSLIAKTQRDGLGARALSRRHRNRPENWSCSHGKRTVQELGRRRSTREIAARDVGSGCERLSSRILALC